MGIRRKKCNVNIPSDCDCSAVFDIDVEVTAIINGIPEQGTLFLEGMICPDCNNKNSNFEFRFRDNDTSDGDQSFTLKILGLDPPLCGPISGNDTITLCGVAIFDPIEGDKAVVTFQITLLETPGAGDDEVQIVISSLSCGITPVLITISENSVPDEDITIEDC
ncbi:hypothetical protein [Neobacillus sp. CF12]|uniref:hypothetical protein n=1 Tax=Neobacillus sp. CF12 TaxID=3055864 RepID=UPI0025A17CD2|nr:hypothetical protein [Neobacillus sp. CF12]MDM5330335.1 hypothetical protein [Neobacillus sp. CF12]